MDDKKIVELFFARNESAITETANKYNNYLKKIAMNILSDEEDSKESLNDTYLAAWNSIPPNHPKNLSSYLTKITRRCAIDIYRKKNRNKRKESQYALSLSELSDCIPSQSPSPEQSVETKHLAKLISEFLYTQKKVVRTVFIGRYYFLDPIKDIAKYCNMSESKVKSILYRTRISLKSFLEKEGYNV